MHRIYQSRRNLTASIASAAKAEEELLTQAAKATQEDSNQSPLPSPKSTNELPLHETNARKRPLEDTIIDDDDADENDVGIDSQTAQLEGTARTTHSNTDRTNCNNSRDDGDLGLPPHKKAAILNHSESIQPLSSTALVPTTTTTDETALPNNPVATITPPTKTEAPVPTSPSDRKSTAGVPAGSENSHTPLPKRTEVPIDLRTPSPSQSIAIDSSGSEVCVIDMSTAVTSRKNDHLGGEINNDDEEVQILPTTPISQAVAMDIDENDAPKELAADNDEEEEIQVISSNTINPNVQYPHKRTDCGVFSFSTDPSKFCNKCYCVVCDIPAGDCASWGDHASQTCRPARPKGENDDNEEDDEGYDVTDEILLESPTATRNEYEQRHRRRLDGIILEEDDERDRRRHGPLQSETDKMKISDVLSKKLRAALTISEGIRMPLLEMDTNAMRNNSGSNTAAVTTIAKLEKGSRAANEAAAEQQQQQQQQKNAMSGDIPQLSLHSSFFVEGIKIGWPFPAIMLPQRQMAMHIVKGLKRSLHVVLESPTGTGKSVAILCSVLAWQRYHMQTKAARAHTEYNSVDDDEEEERRDPQIIYCSRTHSQVTQMVASLKKTPYRPTMTILGSRERMCIHKKLTGEYKKTNKMPLNLACQARRLNTEADRRKRLKNIDYDDNNPHQLYEPEKDGPFSGDDIGEGEYGAAREETDGARPRMPKPTCPHFRQLSTNRTADMAVKQLMGGHRLKSKGGACCGGSSAVGGEETTFGVHDMEDLVRFGKNPYKEEKIAVYRGCTGKFGFSINNNSNNEGIITKGCHVVSLSDGGAAAFEARLQDGDKILKINGKDVRTWNKTKIVELLGQIPKNQPARLNVLRASSDTPELLEPEKDLVGVHETNQPDDIYSEHAVCPYYLSRAIQSKAELTFAPYNYILDPSIRRIMNISLRNAVIVLDEAHNVESTLCEGGSGKYGEMDLYPLICTLGYYSRRQQRTGNITLVDTGADVDSAKLAHSLLMFVEKIILHMRTLRKRFESSPGRQKFENEYMKYRNTPDNHEIELSFDGPTGYGIKGAAVGCQPFLTRLGITKEECARLLEFAVSMEQELFGGKSKDGDSNLDDDTSGATNVLADLVDLLSKLKTATENPEHYFVSCVVQANGNLDHAFEIEDDGNRTGQRRFKKKPKVIPFMPPRTKTTPNAFLHVCHHEQCRLTGANIGQGVRHGDYCDGSTPKWECHLVLRLLSPGLLMREISHECRSVILASGSLAPLQSVCAELNLFGSDSSTTAATQGRRPTMSQSMLDAIVRSAGASKVYTNRLQTTPKPLEANHVINLQKQLLAVSIGHFPTGEKLTISYSNYNKNPAFLPKFGHAVASVIDGVPQGGCLVFFPSYGFLNKCVRSWKEGQHFIWGRFLRSKGKVIVEPTGGQEEFENARDEYTDTIRDTGSCILLAVFRGKMSEGIDFNDANARAVLCIGMPLPNWTDRSVKAKQAYNDEQRKLKGNTSLLPGRDFYSQQAYRAIAQALGRCIRHGADYGTVILMDSRHCHDGSPLVNGDVCRAHKNLPKWMRGSVQTLSMEQDNRRAVQLGAGGSKQPKMIYGGYAGLKREMRSFFAQAPIVSQEVRDKWKADRERALASSSRGSNMVFHRDTGNWSTVSGASSSPQGGRERTIEI